MSKTQVGAAHDVAKLKGKSKKNLLILCGIRVV